ncbi:MAG: hypothetical protein V1913_04695 [Fibrobacterota bacterium]
MTRILVLLVTLLLLSACSLFKTRSAQPPTSFSGRDFTEYSDILDALIDIYANPGRSSELATLLDDTLFYFQADSADASDMSGKPSRWGRNEEISVTAAILSDSANGVAVFANTGANAPARIFVSSDSVVLRWDYQFVRNDNAQFAGTSYFTLVRRQGRFYMRDWKDYRNTVLGYKSWGRWKLENR